MKLNKKIVAGLATAALFAPLALNNVQVHATDGQGQSENKSSENKSNEDKLKDAFKDSGLTGDISDVKGILSKVPSISDANSKIQLSDDDKKPKLVDELKKNNTNNFINDINNESAITVANQISSIAETSNKIKDSNADYIKSYKLDKLNNIFAGENNPVNMSKINTENVDQFLNKISDITKYKNNGNTLHDKTYSAESGGNNSTNEDVLDYENSTSSGEKISSFINGNIELNNGDIINNIAGKYTSQNIESIKNTTVLPDEYKSSKLVGLFGKGSNDKVNQGQVTKENVNNILGNINSINNFNKNVQPDNPTLASKLRGVLSDNNFQALTGIDPHRSESINDDNTIRLVNNLVKLDIKHDDSPKQIGSPYYPVAVNNNNNSNSNNTNQSSKPTETNNSHEVQFPSAPKSDNVVKDSHATKVNNAKADVKKAEKQLANAKSNKAKNNAVKSINKAKANLAKLNGDQKSTLKDTKKSVKKAEKQVKKAKTSDAQKSANASLKAAQTNYTQLNKYIK